MVSNLGLAAEGTKNKTMKVPTGDTTDWKLM